ncbi:hypothetical protein L0668_08520 [Paraglaciecola aquimarina]|uniref:Signal peptide prediction n=1 Tax=Paraglaciecola algarum TaxID=3050085 RepID=A0ABS9D5B1_9ALTE|nr:hypothetical protein [Paraglaciecola sp. G1-23]MCF2948147.1 hypothetical protein [Paraglaciecola sp. G1-23]
MHINWTKKIGDKGIHNAFTDLCEFKEQLFCCYREAKNHVSADGSIRIVTSDLSGKQIGSLKLSEPNTDLRDPKLSITPKGNLLLIAYARLTDINNKTLSTRNLCWVSQTGKSWSSNTEFADKGWWLWRVKWLNDMAYGFAYNRRANAINLYKGHPKRSFHLHQPSVLSLAKHNKGYPNESDLVFINNTAFALVRRDADTYSAQLGVSHFPYKKWQWTDLKAYIGGPAMLKINENTLLIAGRVVQGKQLVTGLLSLNIDTLKANKLNVVSKLLKLHTILPSSGDNSYPGLVLKNGSLYVSYYSSHESNKTNVYLSKLNVSQFL